MFPIPPMTDWLTTKETWIAAGLIFGILLGIAELILSGRPR